MSQKTNYVDADLLMNYVYQINTNFPSSGGYSHGVQYELQRLINQEVGNAITSFKASLAHAIQKASVPYDKCLLCVQRDSCIPPHPLGDNR